MQRTDAVPHPTLSAARCPRLSRALQLAAVVLLSACGDKGGAGPEAAAPAVADAPIRRGVVRAAANPGMDANPLDTTNVLRSFVARGVVRAVPPDGQSLMVRHDAIPGFMPAMTMTFAVRDTNALPHLHAGDTIAFTVHATEEESWIDSIRPTGSQAPAPPPAPDASTSALLNAALTRPGDVLPDATLLSEEGRSMRLSDFRGGALAFTFIFTRCPLPDFCPRMNQHFSRARDLLLHRPGGPTNWQFLSISFDPEFDQPGVLTRYAYSYRGSNRERWLFAAAPTNAMPGFSAQLDFRFANEGGSFLHNLRTVVLDARGRLHRQFDGNRWKAEELAQAMVEAAAVK